jgi:hypothetical protein
MAGSTACAERLTNPFANDRMLLHYAIFFSRQGARFIQDRFRDGDLAHIMQDRSHA